MEYQSLPADESWETLMMSARRQQTGGIPGRSQSVDATLDRPSQTGVVPDHRPQTGSTLGRPPQSGAASDRLHQTAAVTDRVQQTGAVPGRTRQTGATPGRPGGGSGGGNYEFIVYSLLTFAFVGIAVVVLALIGVLPILHQVPEGHVGVYWRGGALLKETTNPGYRLMMPFLTQFEAIQVTLQTDQVKNVPCGTKGGVMITFERIEVVNRLKKDYVYDTLLNYGVRYDNTWIYDKIHHEINQFCSSHSLQEVYIDMFDQIDEEMKEALQADCTRYAPGIEIFTVRITKPTIPNSIKNNFVEMEEERTKVLIAVEKQRVVEKEAETQKKIAISEAEKNAKVSMILMEQKLMEKDSSRMQQDIENKMYMAREKSLADADFYRVLKEGEANKLMLTPQYLELKFIQAIANNTKIFFGDKVPNMVFDQRLLGNFLQSEATTGA